MKRVLIFGAGKSSTVLIDSLFKYAEKLNINVIVADMNISWLSKYTNERFSSISFNISDSTQLKNLVNQADIIVSLLPPQFHWQIAQICLEFSKHFITASYLDENIKKIENQIVNKNLYFVNEMGLDPGIDHLLALEMIHEINDLGGQITSFESYCGGLVALNSDTNPFRYKITWNPQNVVNAGKSGAIYLENNKNISLSYPEVFKNFKKLNLSTGEELDIYANRNSMSYISLYGLQNVQTFIRGTFRYPNFIKIWSELIRLNLTNDELILDNEKLKKLLSKTDFSEIKWLYNNVVLTSEIKASQLLNNLLQQKLIFDEFDQDRVILYHKIGYKLDNQLHEKTYILDRIGQNKQFTAMAESVGLPILASIELILENKFPKFGLILPFDNQIYKLVLNKLRTYNLLQ